jgi:hypothetical protein
VAENAPLDISDQRQMAIIREPTMEFSVVWQVRCGEVGAWKYPGERAMSMPIANYVKYLAPKYAHMVPVTARGTKVTVYVPTGSLIQKTYNIDVRDKKGHMAMFQQRLLGASVLARLQQSGADLQMVEYHDASDVGTNEGLYVTLKPTAFALVNGGLRRDWNPKTKWDQYMSVPVNRYETNYLAFGDAGATFAARAGLD